MQNQTLGSSKEEKRGPGERERERERVVGKHKRICGGREAFSDGYSVPAGVLRRPAYLLITVERWPGSTMGHGRLDSW